jgi:hypothetical protein
MSVRLPEWQEIPGDALSAALSCAGPYVVSHRPAPRACVLSFRPCGYHLHVGDFASADEAKSAAALHWASLPSPPPHVLVWAWTSLCEPAWGFLEDNGGRFSYAMTHGAADRDAQVSSRVALYSALGCTAQIEEGPPP